MSRAAARWDSAPGLAARSFTNGAGVIRFGDVSVDPASRTDPGPNFPYARLMNRIKQLLGKSTTTASTGDDDDMGYASWSDEDKAAFKRDVGWAANAYKRDGEKVDASHMLAYIYSAIKRVDTATQAIWKVVKPLSLASIANAVARRPVVSRHPDSKGKTYGWDTFESVTNANSHETKDDVKTLLTMVGEIAKNGGSSAAKIAEGVLAKLGEVKVSLTLDQAEAAAAEVAKEVAEDTAAAADAVVAEAKADVEAQAAAVPNAEAK